MGTALMSDGQGTPFAPQRVPVPAALRTAWRIPTLVLLVSRCRAGEASWAQLHFLSWALAASISEEAFRRRVEAGFDPWAEEAVRIDPTVLLTVDRCVGARLLVRTRSGVALTSDGLALVERLETAGGFHYELKLLTSLGRKVSKNDANEALRVSK